ncbi:hypothetical protein N9062_01910 [Akkermansiaceae bacterium]|nr:hypothetical protein [Akkermansiaceae bacterium]MDB4423610.1 hypothetical protein [bacterium]MDA7867400.1 hypothetical protein [Akkermansiaceae bacterium]MDA7891382.1 hypothetical protein [Akkermansiaceae bacterium]MDA7934183.1 hypothetical protein [Akkermansiaceae bacterium]
MKYFFFALGSLLFAVTARAQWQSTTYTLKGGWNSIYLHGDAKHDTIANLLPAEVLEVWRWNPNPNQVGFITSPLVPAAGTPEWSVWKRDGSVLSLSTLTGQTAYLVKCSGAASDTQTVTIAQQTLPPANSWVRNGANFLGFPSYKNGSTYPTMGSYFSTFPAALAANSKVYKYVGGELGPSNPVQIFSPSTEPLDATQGYWFSAELVGNFNAPLEVSLSTGSALDFGRNGNIITARLYNRSSSIATIAIAPVASAAAPASQETIAASVPITQRTFDAATATWTEALLDAGGITQVIAPGSTVELSFGISRAEMTAAAGSLYASFLRFTDSASLTDLLLPVRARTSSFAGLWVGDALVSAVESKPESDEVTATSSSYPLRYIVHVDDSGTARILSQVFLGQLDVAGNARGLCTKESGLLSSAKSGAARIVAAHLPLDRVLTATGAVGNDTTLTQTIDIPFNDPTNPFVHKYHPDHDNKSASGSALTAGQESYNVSREVTFTFTASPPEGSIITGWGSSVIGGNYAETIQGLSKDTLGVGTGDGIQLSGTFELRRVSEIGELTVSP